MFEPIYRHMQQSIAPAPSLVEDTIQLVRQTQRTAKKHRRPLPALGAAAAVVVCLMLTASVLAANVPEFYSALYAVSPRAAQFFIPVRQACEDNGIRMEVLSAYIHHDTAEIYISMQDTEGLGRIDETTDLYDSYSIHRPFSSAATCSLASYDPDIKRQRFFSPLPNLAAITSKETKSPFPFPVFWDKNNNTWTFLSRWTPSPFRMRQTSKPSKPTAEAGWTFPPIFRTVRCLP